MAVSLSMSSTNGRTGVSEGAAPVGAADGVDSTRYLPYAVLATAVVVVLPAVVLLPLAPLEGLLDIALSAVLAIGLSVAAGSAGAALWTRRPESREVVFGDLMLWRWARRAVAQRRVARMRARLPKGPVAVDESFDAPDPLLPALCRLADEVDARDSFMRGHSRRVARHAVRIATGMGLAEKDVERIRSAAELHDVGMLFVPRPIAAQPARLTPDEHQLVKRHAAEGAELVSELGDPELTAIVRHHHERFDGRGYPDGLAGRDIPLGARILAVADSYDAITSERPYRRASSHRSALDAIAEEAGAQFDAAVVSAFLEYCSDRKAIAGVAFFATAPPRLASWIAAAPAGVGASTAPIAQGVCTAGAVAIAGACIGGAPGMKEDSAARAEADQAPKPAAILRDGPRRAAPAVRGGTAPAGRPVAELRQHRSRGGSSRPTGRGGGGPDERAGQPGAPAPSAPTPVAQAPPRQAPAGGTAPRPAPRGGPTAPATGGGGTVLPGTGDVLDVPDLPVEPPPAPVAPQRILDPVVDTVDRVLAPAPEPIQRATDPVRDLLGRTGLTSPR